MRRSPRFQDWPERLARFLADGKLRVFSWGAWDCSLFGAEAVKAMTGDDFGVPFRGKYTDAAGAIEALSLYGGGDLKSTVTGFLGAPLASPRFAQRGDIALFSLDGQDALGVVDLSGTRFAAVSDNGLAFLKLERAAVAWRV